MREDIDRVVDGGESRFPNFFSFIASDLVTDEKIRDAHAHGNAAVIVDEHEHVTVLPAPDPLNCRARVRPLLGRAPHAALTRRA
jgi:hypothetical protein